jgi:Arc/MetJ-type ribon-helix-helix transcriptional regulator
VIRRTVSLPDDLAAAIDAAVAAGAAPNVSRFVAAAARRHLDALRAQRLAVEAGRLDPAEEAAMARRPVEPAAERGAPWGRVR